MGVNAIVGQSGGPTSVINASLAGVYAACAKHGIPTVYGMRHGVQGLLKEELVNLTDKLSEPDALDLLVRTPATYLGSCRCKLPDINSHPAIYENLFAILEKYDIGYFFYIGGNDSMDTILKLSDYARKVGSSIRFIGVPKTIDNDLMITDHTPGFGSAAKYIATTIKELVRDSTIYDLRSVTVVEVMGRNAGWLTAAAALAEDEDCEGAAMICLPEVPFDLAHFTSYVERLQYQTPSIVIAVSEGVKLADGRYVCELNDDDMAIDAFGHKYLGGTARCLANHLSHKLGIKTRAVELSTPQRCAAHTASLTDIEEAQAAGAAAVNAAVSGQSGMMVALTRTSDTPYHCEPTLHDIHDVANFEKVVPTEMIDAENYRMRAPFFTYALPLIQGEMEQVYVRGLPRHLTLK